MRGKVVLVGLRPSAVAASLAALVFSLSLPVAAVARDIDGVSFRDASTGFIGGGYTTASGTRQGFVSVTTDGGRTWSATAVPYTRMRAVCAVPDGGFAGSDYFDWIHRYTDTTGMWRTSSAAPVAGSLSIFSIARLTSGRVVAVGMREPGSSKYAYITSSLDGGTTWTRDFEGPKYPPKDAYTDPPSTNASFVGVDESPDGALALVVGNEWTQGTSSWVYSRRLAYRSTDGGSTWTTLTVPTDPNQKPISAVAVATSQTAFAFGQARQYIRTLNGGEKWTLHSLPAPSPLVAVDILGADARGERIVAVGTNGMTVRSLDGGQTWEYTRVWGAGTLRAVAMLTDDEWIAVGSNEVILRTTDAGASWQGTLMAEPPSARVTAPANGFALSPLPVSISGDASDVGVGVTAVEYRVQRADGKFFTGAGWSTAETWLPAEWSGTQRRWAATWTPDAETVALGLMVTIRARATDGLGSVGFSNQVFSSVPFTASVSLAGGAAFTTTTTVSAALSASGATHMRWRVDSGPYTAWQPYATSTGVVLPSGDGTKTVTFEFSADGGLTTLGSASDDIVVHTSLPDVAITAPVSGHGLSSAPVAIGGWAADVGGPVASVELLIRRSDGRSWTGNGWAAAETWLPAVSSDGFATWSLTFVPDTEVLSSGGIITVIARATDAFGLTSASAPVHLLAPATASVVLADGAATTESRLVTATVSATSTSPPTHLRWRVDEGPYSAWRPYATVVQVELTSGDGTKTVTFEFSADGGLTAFASGSDEIVLVSPTGPPELAVTAPAAGFVPVAGTVAISGAASDAANAVVAVEVLIRRADGASWDGSRWVTGDTWLAAASGDGYATWEYLWQPSLADITGSGIVSVSARARNGRGDLVAAGPVTSSAPLAGSVVVAGGGSAVNTVTVPVVLSAPRATHVRWRVGDEPFGAWYPIAAEMTATLPAGDGVKRLHVQFSPNGADPGAEASSSVILDTQAPWVGAPSVVGTVGPVTVSLVASDALSGVAAIEVELDGVLQAEIASAAADIPVTEYGQHTVRYRARDRAGNRSSWQELAIVVREPTTLTLSAPSVSAYASAVLSGRLYDSSGVTLQGARIVVERSFDNRTFSRVATVTTSASDRGGWLFRENVAPTRTTYYRVRFGGAGSLAGSVSVTRRVVPRVYLSAPSFGRTRLSARSSYRASGDLKPRHASGTYPVRIIAQRKVGGVWRTERTVSARVSDYASYSRYAASVRLARAGQWRVRAYHPADALNAATDSAWRYVTVTP